MAVPGTGVEPVRPCGHRILSPACLPIPPPGRSLQPPGAAHRLPQTPLKGDLSGKRDSNSRPQPWQGCALPTELFPQHSIHHPSSSPFCAAKVGLFFLPAIARGKFFIFPEYNLLFLRKIKLLIPSAIALISIEFTTFAVVKCVFI